ncbi:hypothetical protein LSTR_LSTR011454 [Laodelphax striatellus]|uniref:Protein kinase domain-containing protein n=1 Tax=Laodelphax striatellus TaxID=195883 RepID=A0A482WH80_LAOST|nr:hypothetical protein LSTR_LSTR011454 [Laodelphax striatellus]
MKMSASSVPEVPQYLRYVDDLPTVKINKYQMHRHIATGGFGRVYESTLYNEPEGQRFALKVKSGNSDITLIERKEIHALKTLEKEENIVRLVDIIRAPKDLIIAMPLAKTDLEFIVGTVELPISKEERRTILFQLFSGICAIHKNKIIHRDIKPANVLISAEGIVQITDFGISEPLVIGEKRSPQGGTLYYKALELLMEDDEYDEKVDVWAAGCTMAELWMRKHLFQPQAKTIMHQIEAISKCCSFPTEKVWPKIVTFKHYAQIEYVNRQHKRKLLPSCIHEIMQGEGLAADLLLQLLVINPEDRISSSDSLAHVYFKQAPPIQPHVKTLLDRMT